MLAEFSLDKVPLPLLLFMFGCLLLIVGLRRRGKKGAKAVPMLARDTSKASEVRGINQELRILFAELQETARRLVAQVDNRATKLELLIQEADEKIKRLETLQGQAAAKTSDRSTNTARALENLVTPLPADSKYRRIYKLADRGHNAREIAQELSASPGEVELILNLRSKSPAGSV